MAGIWFWVVAGAISFGLGAYLLGALARGGAVVQAGPMALALYRSQLAEIDRDIARGTLTPIEADRLRTEVQRRMLEAGRDARPAPAQTGSHRFGFVVVIAALGTAFAMYFSLGAPDYPDLPLAKRLAMAEANYNARPSQAEAEAQVEAQNLAAPKSQTAGAGPDAGADAGADAPALPDTEYADLMAQLRAAVKARPTDVQGLTLLAQNEAKLGNFAAAARAYDALVAAKGPAASAQDHLGAAQAMIAAAGGIVTAQSEAALMQTLKLDPENGLARYFAGLMFAQTGRPDRAFDLWEPLARSSPPDAPWSAPIAALLPQVAEAAGVPYTPPAAMAQIGPDGADIAAAAGMSADVQRTMINTMVTGLEERLLEAGGSGEEWVRLITSLGVLGEIGRAELAYRAAQAALAGDAAALQNITDAALKAGLKP